MILKVYMEICDPGVTRFRHSVQDLQGREIAVGTNKQPGATLALKHNGNVFIYPKKIVTMEGSEFPFRYPLSKWKKNYGYEVLCRDEPVMRTYTEAAVCQKKFLFKKNLIFNVYQYHGQTFLCFRVGLAEGPSHYYFVKTPQGETVAAIERHTDAEDDRRATVYIKNPDNLELVLLVCGFEIMQVQHKPNDVTEVIDYSAGRYYSMLEEEKAQFDKDFIPAVKAMDRIYD